jgi:hypothetical protein
VNRREILNAIHYLARTGCGWRMSSECGRRYIVDSGALSVACCSRHCTMSPSCSDASLTRSHFQTGT